MATITISTAFAKKVGDSLGTPVDMPNVTMAYTGSIGLSAAETYSIDQNANNLDVGSLLHKYAVASGGGSSQQAVAGYNAAEIIFKNSNGTTLTSYITSEPTVTVSNDGYINVANFPAKTPVAAGTISEILIQISSTKTISFSVGVPGGSADIQFDDRVLVTTQPWRLDGTIKLRVPMSYDFTV